jgi:hypothetical protein
VSETYKLAATPCLFPEGKFEGELRGITFTATSPSDTKHWFTVNCGQFKEIFSKLTSVQLAEEMIASLNHGDYVEFPGSYQAHQFDGGFAYVHNGIPVVPMCSDEEKWLEQLDATTRVPSNLAQCAKMTI